MEQTYSSHSNIKACDSPPRLTDSGIQSRDHLSTARIRAIDCAKGLGILTVIYVHVCEIEPLYVIFYAFNMPLFFALAGMMFRSDKYASLWQLIKKRLRTLICPYILFGLLGILLKVAKYVLITRQPAVQTLQYIGESLLAMVWAPGSRVFGFNVPIWFVPCLFLVEILYYFIHKLYEKRRVLFWIVVTLTTAAGWFMESSLMPVDLSFLPLNFCSACFAIGFYAVGNVLYPVIKPLITKEKETVGSVFAWIGVFLASAAVTVLIGEWNGKVSMGQRILNNGLLFVISGLAGTAAFLALAILLKKSRFLCYCGKNSFTIMASHVLVYLTVMALQPVVLRVLPFLGSLDPLDPLASVFVYAFTLAGTLICVLLYNLIKNSINKKRSEKNGRAA